MDEYSEYALHTTSQRTATTTTAERTISSFQFRGSNTLHEVGYPVLIKVIHYKFVLIP